MIRSLRFGCVALLGTSAFAQHAPVKSAADVAKLTLPDVRITSAEMKAPEDAITVPYCKVAGIIGTEIHFELLLPTDWNGRFFMGGGGGYVGSVQNSALHTINSGYATSGTDTGHTGDGLRADWALDNLERQVDFGYLAVHRTAEVSKAIVRAYYGADSEFNYFMGASRGGGQALMEAQRFPADFDGIVAGCPAQEWTGFAAEMVQNEQLNFPDPANMTEPVITEDNLKLLGAKVLEACDGFDGVTDGTMEDPRDCTFDLASIPTCPDGEASPDCFTPAQRAAIQRIYDGVTADGRIYVGQPLGGEAEPGGWGLWIVGGSKTRFPGVPNLHWIFGTEFFKYLVFNDPKWDYSTYDFSTWPQDTRLAASFMDSTSPDLKTFAAHGGKLIVWHGWSDPALSALRSVQYYEEVKSFDPAFENYFRLYMLPGVLHGAGGSGPDQVDWVSTIVDWVEKKNAPQSVIASKRDASGAVTRVRPLCPYPARAVYKGTGDTNDAANFECQVPARP